MGCGCKDAAKAHEKAVEKERLANIVKNKNAKVETQETIRK